ncbi:MAG: hypothetical protein MJE66_09905 [Proteobacteria bacterium]|nr:hypothetical protein [Pseudomonadota bacterium]
MATSAGAQTVVGADVTTDTTWCGAANPSPIILEQPIFVKDGATLTILPGCIVRGQPRTQPVQAGVTAGTPGALIVTQTGRIIADANPGSPIIFTTAAVDNDNDGVADNVSPADAFADAWTPGDVFLDDTPTTAPLAPLNKAGAANVSLWGGLVINGSAPTNLSDGCGVGLGRCTIEGLTIPGFDPADATYGGILPHDSSGTLRYISVRHAGDEIGSANELNGISLGGVGDGTVMENVEVYANFDDGIEWFGGTVNGKNLVVVFAGDDTFDLDQGYTGINTFALGIMPFFNENGGGSFGSASGDKAGEWDGDDFSEAGGVNIQPDGTCTPFSNPAMYNLTIIGSTPDAGSDFAPVSPASANRGIQMRNGFAGELLNSVVINTGTAPGFDVDSGIGDGCPGFDTIDNVGTCTAQVLATTFDDGAALGADELAALACGDADVRTPATVGDNVVNNFLFGGLVNEDTTFDPTGDADGKLVPGLKSAPINPRLTGFIGVAGAVQAPAPFAAASFRGAFDSSVPVLWTADWTVLSMGGLLAD